MHPAELCLRRTYGRDSLIGLLLTFGAALVIEEGIRVIWGSTERQLPLPEAISGAFMVGGLIQNTAYCPRRRLRPRASATACCKTAKVSAASGLSVSP